MDRYLEEKSRSGFGTKAFVLAIGIHVVLAVLLSYTGSKEQTKPTLSQQFEPKPAKATQVSKPDTKRP
jgi:hypothetical protein